MIRKSTTAPANEPTLMEFTTAPAASRRRTNWASRHDPPGMTSERIGMSRSPVSDVTTLPIAPPMMTPSASDIALRPSSMDMMRLSMAHLRDGRPCAFEARSSERGLDVQESLVVVERHRVALLVELDALDARHAHAAEPPLEREERPRLDARAPAERRDAAVVHDRDAIAQEADAHAELRRPAEPALDHRHAFAHAQRRVAERRPPDLRALLVEVAQRDPSVLAHGPEPRALDPPAPPEEMVVAGVPHVIGVRLGLHLLVGQLERVDADVVRQRRVALGAPELLGPAQRRVERLEALGRWREPLAVQREVAPSAPPRHAQLRLEGMAHVRLAIVAHSRLPRRPELVEDVLDRERGLDLERGAEVAVVPHE